jgi:type IV secretory pathway TraG/TraD family ATPase VirD4
MSKNYKVTGHIAILGVGVVLKLSSSQASIRQSSLKQKSKDTYTVLEPVQFKQGEEIVIVSGNVSKSLLSNLTDLSEDKKSKDDDKNQKPANNKKSSSKDQKNKSDKKDDKKADETSNEVIDLPEDSDEGIVDNNDINNLPNV